MSNIVTIDKPMTATEIRQQVNTIQHVMREVMHEDVHYGVIAGTKTPSLYKPGAEKIMATFRLAADPEITNLSDEDQIRYQVRVRLTSVSGVFVGAGIGEASSNEEKYKWRAAVCEAEFDEAPPDRKREKWVRGRWDKREGRYGDPYKVLQIRTEPADLANTILKMAKKRALVDGVLTATAASDIFTQDLEDLPEELVGDNEGEPRPPRKSKSAPKQRQAPAVDGPATEAQVRLLKAKLQNSGKTVEDYCKAMGVESIETTPFAKVNDALAWITE